MSQTIRKINNFFKNAISSDIEKINKNIVLSERQEIIFKMKYLQKKDINFIADSLNVCPMVINNELKIIRKKIVRILELE